MDVIIDTLIVEENRPAHIARHHISLDETVEAISKDYLIIKAKFNRWILIGETKKKKFLAVIVGKRPSKNTWGLITARPASRHERKLYIEHQQKAGDKDEN